LFLNANICDDESSTYLAECIHNIDELHLRDCKITKLGIEKLSQAVAQRKSPVSKKTLVIKKRSFGIIIAYTSGDD